MNKINIFLIFITILIVSHSLQAQNKYSGQWLLNASGKYTGKGYGFSIGGEKYLANSYSSLRGEFTFLRNKNNFDIADLRCHVNAYFFNLTYFYSLEAIDTKPFILSLGIGLFAGTEKLSGAVPYGIKKRKGNHFLFGFHFTPQAETPLSRNLSAYLEPSIGIKTNTLQNKYFYSISIGLKYYLPFK